MSRLRIRWGWGVALAAVTLVSPNVFGAATIPILVVYALAWIGNRAAHDSGRH